MTQETNLSSERSPLAKQSLSTNMVGLRVTLWPASHQRHQGKSFDIFFCCCQVRGTAFGQRHEKQLLPFFVWISSCQCSPQNSCTCVTTSPRFKLGMSRTSEKKKKGQKPNRLCPGISLLLDTFLIFDSKFSLI